MGGTYPNTTTATLHLLLGSVASGAMTALGTTLSVTTTGFFTSADVGARIMVLGASTLDPVTGIGAPLFTTVASFTDGQHVDLTLAAATSVTATTENVVIFREKSTATDGVALVSSPLTFQSTLQARDTFSFRYQSRHSSVSPATTFVPLEGQPVLLVDDNLGEIFGGILDQVTLINIPGDTGLYADCLGITYDILLSKRTTQVPTGPGSPPQPNAGVFTNQTLAQIATYLVGLAAADGVTLSSVTGPVIPSYQVNYATLYNALDQVCQLASNSVAQFQWFTDTRRVVHIVQIGTIAAPWNLSYTDASDQNALQLASGGGVDGGVKVTFTKQNYANKAVVKIGNLAVGITTESFVGNGSLQQFETSFPVAAAPTITIEISSPLADMPQTVGVLGIDTGKQWYWNLGSNVITQDPSGTPIPSTYTLSVTYQGVNAGVITSSNTAEIARRAAVEGGTGIYEVVQDAGTPASLADAQTLAAALSNSLGVIPETVSYGIFRGGLQIGMTQRIDLLQLGVSDNFVIDSVTMTTQGNFVLWQITATRGPVVLNWQNMLQSSIKQAGTGGLTAGLPVTEAQPITTFTPVRTWIDEVNAGPSVGRPVAPCNVPFRYNGYLYDAANLGGASPRFSVWRSSDNGRTWTELDSGHAPAFTAIEGVCVFDGGTTAQAGEGGYFLHCAVVHGGTGPPPTQPIYLYSFNLATELWGTSSPAGPNAASLSGIWIRQWNNRLVVAYDIGNVGVPTVNSRLQLASYDRNNNVWSSATDLGFEIAIATGNGNNADYTSITGVVDNSTGKMHFFVHTFDWQTFMWQAIEPNDSRGSFFFFITNGLGPPIGTYQINGNATIVAGHLVVGIVTLDGVLPSIYSYRILASADLIEAHLAVAGGWAVSAPIVQLSG